jgi:signal transduction histidine kinase
LLENGAMRSFVPRFGTPLASAAELGLRAVVGYLLLYVAVDWVSFIHPMRGLNVTPWNPQAALAVALLVWRPRLWWLVWAACMCADVVVRIEWVSWPATVCLTALQAAGYSAIAAALHRWVGRETQLRTPRDFVAFLAVLCGGALLASVLHAVGIAAFRVQQPERLLAAVHRGWIGDGVGLLVTLPLLLVLTSAQRRADTLAMARTVEWWLVAGVACGGTLLVFARSPEEQFKFFYLLFLPAAWGAARFGVTGAVWAAAVVQLLLIGAVQSAPYQPLTVFELQLLMAVLAATGLLLGTIVDEREETARKLRSSLRLAAAGDMAAALAHELNQPLAALTSYARASQLLTQQLEGGNRAAAQRLGEVTGKLVDEAARASGVVKRLRDFFRDRSTELRPSDVAVLVQEAVQSQAARALSSGIRLRAACEPGLPPVWLDPVQIGVVLRNLVANALDAALPATPDAGAAVVVTAGRRDSDVVVCVADSGPGLGPEEWSNVFESRRSAKPGGMGIGLSISREIVEAHGGRVWAEPGPGGRFYFSLPTTTTESHE